MSGITTSISATISPMPNIDVMASNIRFWVKNNAEGVMLQGGYQGPAEFDELKCWVTSKLLWDPHTMKKQSFRILFWDIMGRPHPQLPSTNHFYRVFGKRIKRRWTLHRRVFATRWMRRFLQRTSWTRRRKSLPAQSIWLRTTPS